MKVHDNARKFNILLNVPQFSAVTLKPSGIRGCGATQAFLTGRVLGIMLIAGQTFFPHLFSFPLYLLTFPRSHTQKVEASSQVNVKSPTFQTRRSKILVCHGSRTDKAVPAPLKFSQFWQSFGVALGLPRKLIWGMQAEGGWPLCFCHDVER